VKVVVVVVNVAVYRLMTEVVGERKREVGSERERERTQGVLSGQTLEKPLESRET